MRQGGFGDQTMSKGPGGWVQDRGSLAENMGSSASRKLTMEGWAAHVALPAECVNICIQARGMPPWRSNPRAGADQRDRRMRAEGTPVAHKKESNDVHGGGWNET